MKMVLAGCVASVVVVGKVGFVAASDVLSVAYCGPAAFKRFLLFLFRHDTDKHNERRQEVASGNPFGAAALCKSMLRASSPVP